MAKKILLALVLSVCTAGAVFSQTDFKDMAKNTITVDLGPTIVGIIINAVGDVLGGAETGISSSGFGIGAQYERQLLKQLSVAARFTYLGGGLGFASSYTESGITVNTSLGVDIRSFSIEGHARYYPLGETFFLDGMLGYANMKVIFSGDLVGTDQVSGASVGVSANMDASQGFFTLGAKIGWRIKFGKRKDGFIFEPSLGYVFGIGLGDTVWKKLEKQIRDKSGDDIEVDGFVPLFEIVQNFLFIGGPRFSLAFGWRF